MQTWLRGKSGGLIAFLAIAVLVIGGMGWITALALRADDETRRLEQEQREARRRAEQEARDRAEYYGRMRVAVWQLDSWLLPVLSREANRPYYEYTPVYKPQYALVKQGDDWKPASVLQPSPLLSEELPEWMLVHFQVDEAANWDSPQVFQTVDERKATTLININIDNATSNRERMFDWLKANYQSQSLFERLAQQERQMTAAYEVLWNVRKTGDKIGPGSAVSFQPNASELEQEYLSRWFQQRSQLDLYAYGHPTQSLQGPYEHPKRLYVGGTPVRVGALSAMWLNVDDGIEKLVVARTVEIGAKKKLYQGVLIDMSRLKRFLLPKVRELFPGADLRPMTESTPKHPERAMTALPLEVVPPAASAPPVEATENNGPDEPLTQVPTWNPLHVGLTIGWLAAILALVAVAWGGYALIDHSQRRMQFVSAVTHELRTPLTTLRLYLDMLTGGMVAGEERRAEYLQTLSAETDRLNRLVTNVLDFSRLEKHTPRLQWAAIKPDALAKEIETTWAERCRAADKQLVVESDLASSRTIRTDATLLQQIIGNLIDNACKYARPARDPRITLRVKADGEHHIVLEVEDHGPGVPAAERGLIFQAFRQGRGAQVSAAGGVGLGLALASRWARLLGGELSLHSPASGGACFLLRMPAA